MASKVCDAASRARRGRFAVILGANEIASAVAVALCRAGWSVALSHDPYPPVIRRKMAFHDVLFGDEIVIEGVRGELVEMAFALSRAFAKPDCVAVTPLLLTDLMMFARVDVLIDARMQKRNVAPDLRSLARLTIGLGPEFHVGRNCDLAIETRPDHVGEIVESGGTLPDDGLARGLGGVRAERFIYAERAGLWHAPVDIGVRVYQRMTLGLLDGRPVVAPMDGVLRGIARDGLRVPAGVKLLEIDPRGRRAQVTGVDKRGRAIAEAALIALDRKAVELWADNVIAFAARGEV